MRWLPANEGISLEQTFEELLEEEVQLMKYCKIYPGREGGEGEMRDNT